MFKKNADQRVFIGSPNRTYLSLYGVVAALTLACVSGTAAAQSPAATASLHQEFVEHAFAVEPYGPVRWVDGGKGYTTLESTPGTTAVKEIVRYDTATGQRQVLVAAQQLIPRGAQQALTIDDYACSTDLSRVLIFTNTQRVWRANTRGDYWVIDRQTGEIRRLASAGPTSTTMFATFSPDGKKVAYVHFNNIYVEDLQTAKTWRITADGSDKVINGTSDWVYEEEFGIRDAFRWSPDGTHIAYWQFDASKVKNFALIYDTGGPYQILTRIPYPDFGIYPTVRQVPIPQPGTENSAVRIGVVAASGGETRWMQVPGYADQHYIARMDWAGDSTTLVLQHLNRLQNTNDVLLADAKTGEVHQVYEDKDPAWVDAVDGMQWIHGGKDFLWISERDGWRHVYVVARDGKQAVLATPGAFDVTDVLGADPEERWLYYIASPENPTERYLYRVRLVGKAAPERLTPSSQPGTHTYKMSPDFRWAVHTYSTFDVPPVTELVRVADQHGERTLQANTNVRDRLRDVSTGSTEFFRLDIGDGVLLDSWLIKPNNFDPSKKYPLLVYVYGEPAGQTVINGWDGENGIFHRVMAREGYVIASFDNRGTPAPRGRAWRKIVYGNVGVLSSKEQALALQALERSRPYIDADRVAVWGRSGGGSNTLNLMFRHPELYKVGMSVAPVPDQRLYDSIYQERYMGLPQDNVAGYKAGSPINFAEGLRGALLLVHGSGDDNVHYQGSELLVNRLVELEKPFDFMTYPGRTHALSEGAGTRYHLYSLLARFLESHLPAGPR